MAKYNTDGLDLSKTSFASACFDYFGKKAGQSTQDFMAELKELTPEDKAQLTKLFREVGYAIA
jgi:hypothetical protein